MLSKFEKDILKGAFVLRLAVWLLSFLSDKLIDDHDHSSALILTASEKPEFSWISSMFKCLLRWDGIFYMGYAQNGYEYLKNHAFFPLFYIIVSNLQSVIFAPFKEVSVIDSLLLTGILLNLVVYLSNVLLFYRLSLVYLKNENLARKAAILFMLSPASIFFSAFYTESLFCFFTFLGYYFLYDKDPQSFRSVALSTIFFTLSGFIRSNGNFYLLIVGYQLLHRLIKLIQDNRELSSKATEALQIIGVGLTVLVVMNVPYVSVMRIPYLNYCKNFAEYPLAAKPSFCQSLLPNAYPYIQDKFWDVGFLTSWQPRKIFFVIWGIPMLVLMLLLLVKYYRRNFLNTILLGIPSALNSGRSESTAENDAFYSSKNIPTILLTTIMFVVNTFFAHINVSSRINSSNPMIYWYAAYSISVVSHTKSKQGGNEGLSFKNHWIVYYFIFYVVTGCTVFTNFYLFV